VSMVIIQARMSSTRLPGKVLELINGQPILGILAERCASAVGEEQVIIATSAENSDKPIVEFANSRGLQYCCGSLDNVYERFTKTIMEFKLDNFVRVCADSPFLDPELISTAILKFNEYDVDLVTNIFPRSYPKGQSVEVIRAKTFLNRSFCLLDGFSSEHVTQTFYQNSHRFDILNFSGLDVKRQELTTWAVDTSEDLSALREWAKSNPEGPRPFGIASYSLYSASGVHA